MRHLEAEQQKYPEECQEPIHVIGYSNGSNVIYHAMTTYDAKFNNVLLLGASLDADVDFSAMIQNSDEFHVFWSEKDSSATWIVDGIGYQGLSEEWRDREGVFNQHVPDVWHSIHQGTTAGFEYHTEVAEAKSDEK